MPSNEQRKLRIVGEQYGRLTVMYRMPRESHKNHWMCACECGSMVAIFTGHFRGGQSKSCGCLSRETAAARSTKHGHSVGGKVTRTFQAYRSMLMRCLNPKVKGYENYGGRGIKPCESWLGERGFETFLSDMGECPSGLTLERDDFNGDYSPENCRWATAADQARNKRNVHLIDGVPKTVWAKQNGVDLSAAYRRAKSTGRHVFEIIKEMGGVSA